MSSTPRITTTAAVILSLAAAGAPTATASPSGTNPAGTANQAPATVYSRPDKSMIRLTTPHGGHQPSAVVYSREDKSLVPTSTSDRVRVAQTGSAPQAVVRIQAPSSGFDWGDAGIGVAGGLALAMLGLGGALVVSQRRPRRNRQTTHLS